MSDLLQDLNKIDPLKRMVEKQTEQPEFSPMDPPDAFSPPSLEGMDADTVHPLLQMLMEEHRVAVKKLDEFDQTIQAIAKNGYDKTTHQGISDFFRYFDENLVKHNQKEELGLFPLLKDRLLASGEHAQSHGDHHETGVDIMEDDHIKALQLAAIVFNFVGISVRLPDPKSGMMILDAGLEQAKALIELLRLHIFREDNVIFPQAQRLLSVEEMDAMLAKLEIKNQAPAQGEHHHHHTH
ncbi:MAG: hemerythrin domain-containing protein [Bacteroidetes bacterium]|jgi:hemerythrin-like domain-containing protein|nr:hemerythrin domain-containing protein [Bacteroidota bacterium]